MNFRPKRSVRLRTAALILVLTTVLAGCSVGGDKGSDAKNGDVAPGRAAFTLAAAGDILIHPQLTEQAAKDAKKLGSGVRGLNFDAIMAGIEPVVSRADLAICHFEPVVGKPGGPFRTYPDFLVPPQVLTSVKKIGYDSCTTASNHTLDHGVPGVKRTLDALDEAGLKHTGSARSRAEAERPLIHDVKGVKVAQLSFAFGFNGREVPKGKPWLVNQNSLTKIKAAEESARRAGAEVVVLSIHWGREHQPNPSNPQLELARQITERTGINLIIGHHAHVVQPMEKVNGTWVAYGLGNQLARHDVPTGLTEEGAIGWFEFTEDKKAKGGWDVRAKYVPTFVDIPPEAQRDGEGEERVDAVGDHRLVDVAEVLRGGEELTEQQRARYRLAFERTRGTMLNRGAAADGLAPLVKLPD